MSYLLELGLSADLTREAQSDRCPYARCSDCAEVSWVASAVGSSIATPALSDAISAYLPHACADLPRSADGAPTASTSPSKERVGGNSPPRPERFDTKPQDARTRTGCWPLPRNGDAPSVILRATKEHEMGREQKYPKDAQDSDAYAARSRPRSSRCRRRCRHRERVRETQSC
jgi:hypothetical protein